MVNVFQAIHCILYKVIILQVSIASFQVFNEAESRRRQIRVRRLPPMQGVKLVIDRYTSYTTHTQHDVHVSCDVRSVKSSREQWGRDLEPLLPWRPRVLRPCDMEYVMLHLIFSLPHA